MWPNFYGDDARPTAPDSRAPAPHVCVMPRGADSWCSGADHLSLNPDLNVFERRGFRRDHGLLSASSPTGGSLVAAGKLLPLTCRYWGERGNGVGLFWRPAPRGGRRARRPRQLALSAQDSAGNRGHVELHGSRREEPLPPDHRARRHGHHDRRARHPGQQVRLQPPRCHALRHRPRHHHHRRHRHRHHHHHRYGAPALPLTNGYQAPTGLPSNSAGQPDSSMPCRLLRAKGVSDGESCTTRCRRTGRAGTSHLGNRDLPDHRRPGRGLRLPEAVQQASVNQYALGNFPRYRPTRNPPGRRRSATCAP